MHIDLEVPWLFVNSFKDYNWAAQPHEIIGKSTPCLLYEYVRDIPLEGKGLTYLIRPLSNTIFYSVRS